MRHAQLIHRGEQFMVSEADTRFEGECVWSWEGTPGEMPRRVYPIRIIVRSIHRCEAHGAVRVDHAEQLRIASIAKRSLEENELGLEVLLLEQD